MLWDLLVLAHMAGEQEEFVDEDFDIVEASRLFKKHHPLRNESEESMEILNYICMGHNPPKREEDE